MSVGSDIGLPRSKKHQVLYKFSCEFIGVSAMLFFTVFLRAARPFPSSDEWYYLPAVDLKGLPIAYFGVVMIGLSGIAAPLVIMEGDTSSPPSREGWHALLHLTSISRFLNWIRSDVVISLTLISIAMEPRHQLDHASATFIGKNRVWEDAIPARSSQFL